MKVDIHSSVSPKIDHFHRLESEIPKIDHFHHLESTVYHHDEIKE